MKLLFTSFIFLFSMNSFAKTLTKEFVVTKIFYNVEEKYYDVHFAQMAGIYKGDKKFLKCFQDSLQSKKLVTITYEPMGLKITECISK